MSVRPSVTLFDRSSGVQGFAADCRAGMQEISIDSGGRRGPSSNGAAAAQGRSTALSSKCGQFQCLVDSRVDDAEQHRLVIFLDFQLE